MFDRTRWSRKSSSIAATNRATGVRVIDSEYQAATSSSPAEPSSSAPSTLESTRLLLNSKSRAYPDGLANSSGAARSLLLRAHHGPARQREPDDACRPRNDERRRAADRDVYRSFQQSSPDKHPDFIRGYGFQGGARMQRISGMAHRPRFRRRVQAYRPAKATRRRIGIVAFGEVLARYENSVDARSRWSDAWGIPAARFNYRVRRQRAEDGQGHGRHCRGDAQGERRRGHAGIARDFLPKAGPFTSSAPRGWATIRRRRSPTRSARRTTSRTCSCSTAASSCQRRCQNPTWTILALARRGSEYLAGQLRSGDL